MQPSGSAITRRRLVGAAAGARSAPTALGAPVREPGEAEAGAAGTRFDHVVVVMMENRSFDHLLGWLPGADGRQAGLSYTGPQRASCTRRTPLAPDFQGCGHPDPDHSYERRPRRVRRRPLRRLAARGRERRVRDRLLHASRTSSFLGPAVPHWTTFSRYFAAILAETFPNRIYQHAGADRPPREHVHDLCTLPTIWDRLAEAGLSGRYYYSDIPFLALWGTKYLRIGSHIQRVPAATAPPAGCPQVAFVDPRFDGEDHGHLRATTTRTPTSGGDAFLASIYRAVTTGPDWSRTVLIVTYDEWGGFFDHVPPPVAPDHGADGAAGDPDGLRGFRVPSLLVSPYARRQYVGTKVYDHRSMLRTIETRWELPPLTIRDAQANDLGLELTPTPGTRQPPQYAVPEGPFGQPCLPAPPVEEDWTGLKQLAASSGWPV